ncbi:MAG TPA: putative baseplate assembly protein [Actinomycetota bacterium]|nr:putative baseplate assembly protein [Actinomycetota bacterium]
MTLPTPTLDDRRFQDIVDEAKRLIPRYCPEWTDHNLSDPGVAMIELFAWMTEMILFRLNQVPDLHYTRFLDLMGIRLFPPAAAWTEEAFWLSAPQTTSVTVGAGTQVGTIRTEQEESIVFMTDADLRIVPPALGSCVTSQQGGQYEDHWDELRIPGETVTCFRSVQPDDAVYFGFEEGLADNILRLELQARVEGVGVDPKRPPWAWEAWNGEEWAPARVYRDGTGGLNADGDIVLIMPGGHEALTVGPTRAFWLRCRLVATTGDQPTYRDSPKVSSLTVVGLGGVQRVHHAQPVEGESLGRSDGSPGQRFAVRRTPVLPRTPDETVVIATTGASDRWNEVADFSASGPDDPHFTWDANTGEVVFGPVIRYPDGSAVQHGAIPPIGATVGVTGYRVGGGTRGNVGAGTLTVLKTSIPFIGRVENLASARGGVDAESVENAKLRGPLSLRTGQRAVTVHDFERLTLEAAPSVARARCLPPAAPGGPVRVLVVPRVDIPPERLQLDDLALPDDLVRDVSAYLDERRILTTAVEVTTPSYQGVTVVARVRGTPGADPELIRDRLLEALYAYLNPVIGGPEGNGWPFGRELNVGEVFALLAGVEGVLGVEEVRLFLADMRTGERREGRQRASISPDAILASFQHQVLVR